MREQDKLLVKLEETKLHLTEIRKSIVEIAWNEKRLFCCVFCKQKIKTSDYSSLEEYENTIVEHSKTCTEKFMGSR